MGRPGEKNTLSLIGTGLVIAGCGLLGWTGVMAVLMIDGFAKNQRALTVMGVAAIAIVVGGVGCLVVAGARASRRERARNSTASHDPDRE